MALLPKGGINIGGHKIPWEAVGALAAVVGVVLVIRARQQGQNVASVGNAPASSPYSAAMSGFGSGGFAPDYSAALANISQQLTNLQQTGIGSPSTASPPPVTVPIVPPVTAWTGPGATFLNGQGVPIHIPPFEGSGPIGGGFHINA